MTHIISSILMLLWYTFYAQFLIITWILEYFLTGQERAYWNFIWHFNGNQYELSWLFFVCSGIMWDLFLIFTFYLRKRRISLNNILDESEI